MSHFEDRLFYNSTQCVSCDSPQLSPLLNLGSIPLADVLLNDLAEAEQEIKLPLNLMLCNSCGLVQVQEIVDPVVLFATNYPYYSSVSPALMAHFKESALDIITQRKLNSSSLVVEAASNDGVMLEVFKHHGCKVLGIDPAGGPAAIAIAKGIDTRVTFFNEETAKQLMAEGASADVFLANNVLAHVYQPNSFVAGMALLLKKDGIAVIEVPYVVDMVQKVEFDTIFHQHISYFSFTALTQLFNRHGLYINHVHWVPNHGGTLRLFAEHHHSPSPQATAMLAEEAQKGVIQLAYYTHFADMVAAVRTDLLATLNQLKLSGATIVGYGAAGKANTLINYMGIDERYLDYIADLSVHKQGKYFTGVHLPIVPPKTILETMPQYVLILAWNFATEIMEQLAEYKEAGGKFIIPIPKVVIV